MGLFIVVLAGYLLGSVSFGIIVTKKLKGIDIREHGSGNAGMTNVIRTIGKGPGALVLLGDALKGAAAVALGLFVGGEIYGIIGGLAALLGHAYPFFFGFRGGKGVATGLGIMLVLVPDVSLMALGVFFLTILLSRYVSLGSILATSSVPVFMIILGKSLPLIVLGIIGATFIIYTHRNNIKKIYQGTEYRLGDPK